MSERTGRDSTWLAELADRAMRWADTEERRWGRPERAGFAASLAWSSAWAATRFARLGGSHPTALLVDDLPGRARGDEASPLATEGAPTIPERISLSEPEPATLLRAASTLFDHGGRELSIGPGAARMWRHFEPVLGPRLGTRGVSVRLTDEAPTLDPDVNSECAVLSLDGSDERSDSSTAGFGGAPVDVVIGPYLHDRRDLRRLGDHLVSELAAPAPGVAGVRLFVTKSWLQSAALREHVEARLSELARAAAGIEQPELRWQDAVDGPIDRHAITVRALNAADTAELFDAARACCDQEQSSSPVAACAYLAPFLLEPEAAAKSFERWRAAHPARVVVLNHRASHAFASGRVPWSDRRYVLPALGGAAGSGDATRAAGARRRSYLESPFLSPHESRWLLSARVRFEVSPTSLAAVRLRLFDGLARF